MNLYSVVTTYHLLEAMIYCLNNKNDEENVIMISHWLAQKYTWYEQLKVIFKDVFVFNANYQYSNDINNILQDKFETLFSEKKYKIEDFNEINVWGAEHSFGAYLFTQKISNNYWEEGAGALSKKDNMLEIFTKAHGFDKAMFQYSNHLADGETDFVNKRFYNKYYQLKEVVGENLVHFDISDELKVMDSKSRNIIINLFWGDQLIAIEDKTALVLTEHFANLSSMDWEEQKLLYKYIVDYFLTEYKLLFKPHPDDLMPYEYEFKESYVIRKKFPAELLPYIFTKIPEMVVTSSSTSIYGLRKIFNHCIEFNFDFSHSKGFYRLNRYYTLMKLLKFMKAKTVNTTFCENIIVENFAKSEEFKSIRFEQNECSIEDLINLPLREKNNIIVIDLIENGEEESEKIFELIEKLEDSCPVIFMNSREDFWFYNYKIKKMWNNFIPIEIRTRALSEKHVELGGPSYIEDKLETIWIYSKRRDYRMFEMKRELPNVGVSVEAKGFDGDKLKIKLLEGMLDATEKRLLYYIDKDESKSSVKDKYKI